MQWQFIDPIFGQKFLFFSESPAKDDRLQHIEEKVALWIQESFGYNICTVKQNKTQKNRFSSANLPASEDWLKQYPKNAC